ncbi:hypothetical protein UN67_18030, partial [Vibrio cholerae O1 biovar El Tor]
QGVQQLCVTGSTQGRNNQRWVSPRVNTPNRESSADADFDVQRTHGASVTAVDTWLAVNDVLANGAVFDFTECSLDVAGGRLAFFAGQLGNNLILQLTQASVTVGLDGDGVGLGDRFAELGTDSAQQFGGFRGSSPGPGWLGSFSGQFF